jgi:hypothetical protein
MLEQAYFHLNSGGIPVVLYRSRFLSGVGERGKQCRIREVRLQWTGSKDPYSSTREPMITMARDRKSTGWTEWVVVTHPFSVDDLMPHAMWGWRSLGSDRFTCPRCVECELRTDEEMLKVYGPFKHKQHHCALKLFTDGGDTIEDP